ncbi:MAG: hypothetical protein HY960_00995 [Ignavibacteriae bacterium]|nr:hypothetical protein [Ignavibacteriota bacterium]
MKTRFLLHTTLCLFVLLLSCQRSKRDNRLSQKQTLSNSSILDTLSPEKCLSLTKDDSLSLHYANSDTMVKSRNINDLRREAIADDSLQYYIHTITNTLDSKHSIFDYCSLIILYSKVESLSNVYKIQIDSIEVSTGALSMFEQSMQVIDVNYDGYKDIIISFTENTAGNVGNNWFVTYDSKQQRFYLDSSLTAMFGRQDIYIDTENEQITTGGRVGLNKYSHSEYQWNGTMYELSAKESSESTDDGKATVEIRKELINGQWQIVKQDTVQE